MNIKKSLSIIIGYTSWCGLGFIRGINYYKHNKYEKKENYFYLDAVCNGFYGLIIYANPVVIPFSVYKEIYRLEA